MKIRNKFLIPLLALILAMLMVGAPISGTAADTEAPETSASTTHPHTYVPPTLPSTTNNDGMIEDFISENLGDLADSKEDVRGFITIMDNILTAIRDFIDQIIEAAKWIGEILVNGGFQIKA